MKLKPIFCLAVAALSVPAGAAPQQFNLRCKGTYELMELRKDEKAPYEKVIRIDLAKKRWCEGECESTTPISSVQETSIILTDVKEETRTMDTRVSETVNRTTGEHSAMIALRSFGRFGFVSSKFWKGTCEVEPFSGFPQPKTKF